MPIPYLKRTEGLFEATTNKSAGCFALAAGLSLGAALLFGAPTQAHAYQGPWCAFYSNGNEDCSLPSREACNFNVQYRPSIGRCYPNDRYRPAYRPNRRSIRHRYRGYGD